MVLHGDEHVHIVVSLVDDLGEVWHARNERRAAQTTCTKLETAYGMEAAPRRREQMKLPVLVERENARFKTHLVASQRAQREREVQEAAEKAARRAKCRDASFSNPSTTRSPDEGLSMRPRNRPSQLQRPRDKGHER